jgi:hypothetical protein
MRHGIFTTAFLVSARMLALLRDAARAAHAEPPKAPRK